MREILDELHVAHLEKSLGYTLSGGERRRVEIARALANNPDFILLDEPFAGIDPIAVEDIQNIVHDLRNKGYGVLITDHNVRETLRITDRAYIIAEGRIFRAGTPHELGNDLEVRRVLLATFASRQKRTKALLEDLTGRPCLGFRAASYSIVTGREWALDVLLEEMLGEQGDVFSFLMKKEGLTFPEALREPALDRRGRATAEPEGGAPRRAVRRRDQARDGDTDSLGGCGVDLCRRALRAGADRFRSRSRRRRLYAGTAPQCGLVLGAGAAHRRRGAGRS